MLLDTQVRYVYTKELATRDRRKQVTDQSNPFSLSRSPLPAGSPLHDPSRCRYAVDGVGAAREVVLWKNLSGGSLDVGGTWKRLERYSSKVAYTYAA